jgi:peptidyl-prolyl cis-trans isomerase D
MFNLFRSREMGVRILLGAVLGLVSLSMLWYLVPGGGLGGPNVSGQNVIAAVGDDKITTTDVERQLQNITRGQTNLPKGVLAMYLPSVVNQMIESKAMAYKAREIGLRVSDQELGDAIQSEFSQAFGKWDMTMYQQVLAQQGMTAPDFERQRREAILGMRLENLETQALVVSDQEARAEYQRKNLKVGLQYIEFEAKNFTSKVNKDPALVKAYFDKNRALFRTPEKRDVVLIVGTTADFVQAASVSDDQLRQEYQDNIDSYRTPERVRVRHILIKTQGKPKEDAPKLKAKAEDLLRQLQHGADFAELAKKNSEDPGSAEKGGELGWVVRGQTVPNFEKAAFSLKPNELSSVIETEYGYHIIQVEEKQSPRTQSFDDVKGQILLDMKKQIAAENLKKAVDAAHSEVARNPAQADAIAAKYGLKIFHVNGFVSGGSLPEVNTQPEVVNSITTASKGSVTDVQDMDNQGKAAFAVVTNIVPAKNAEFADVQNDVLEKYTTAESLKLSEAAAKAAADKARKGETLEALAKEYGVEVKTAAPFTVDGAAEGIGSAALMPAAFKDNIGDVFGPIAAQAGQFVCKVTQKIPADMSQFAKNKDAVVQGIASQRQSVEAPLFRDSVVNDLKKRGKIKINEANLNRMVTSYQS